MSKILSRSHLSSGKAVKSLLILLTIGSMLAFTVSAFYLAESYRLQPFSLYKNSYKVAEIRSQPYYSVFVKPSLIYDYATIVNYSTIYLSLAEKIDYVFNISWAVYNNTVKGSASSIEYSVEPALLITTSTWSKSFTINPEVLETSEGVVVKGSLNIDELEGLVDAIDREIRVSSWRFDANTTLTLRIHVTYSTGVRASYELTPFIALSLNRVYNLLAISTGGLTSSYSEEVKKTLENTITLPLGLSARVSTVRNITTISTLITGLSTIILAYTTLRSYGAFKIQSRERFRRKIVKARVDEYRFKTVVLENAEDFDALARRIDAPIIYSEPGKKYYLIVGDTAYVYSES
ncbi:hypothetical protein [Thermosphaera aggregans]|uniref:DUF5305 domain-containing protein n=1 Tax=Thermosphaera aggregans (strain DSM 11486 / M11TL) TaxID=633148 RepID=D5U227_THEAM|nr:hypothetical protein [Thermosphaera aggregans]ADG91177.1 hypothetical protein Tagg_0905 [Thermosphaera aggregans DSM 11486]